ncbi:MAG: hypothetical protein ACRENP_04060 [Longimicrobiales bacterium]
MTHDPIRAAFLQRQYEEGMALARDSDILRLTPVGGDPPERYVADFHCRGLVRSLAGEVSEANHFAVGIWFPSDYLRHAEPWQILTWLGPRRVHHPNISAVAPYICVGRLVPGTALVDLIYQCFEIITYKKVTMRENDALNLEACAWARVHQDRFPIDTRPLKRRALQLNVRHSGAGAQP